jgi:hypothetical protein
MKISKKIYINLYIDFVYLYHLSLIGSFILTADRSKDMAYNGCDRSTEDAPDLTSLGVEICIDLVEWLLFVVLSFSTHPTTSVHVTFRHTTWTFFGDKAKSYVEKLLASDQSIDKLMLQGFQQSCLGRYFMLLQGNLL